MQNGPVHEEAPTVTLIDGDLRIRTRTGRCTGRHPQSSEFGVCAFSGGLFVGTVGADASWVTLVQTDGSEQRCTLRPIAGTTARWFQATLPPGERATTLVAIGPDDGELFRKQLPRL